MTEEFDDDMLRDALIARSGGPVEPNVGRKAVVVRAGRIRTRRAVALGGSATAVVVAGLVMIPLDRDDTDTPSNVVLPAATVGTVGTVTTAAPGSTIEPDRPTTIADAATTADRPDSDLDENADADAAPADDPAPTAPAGGVTSTLPLSPGPTSVTSNPENTTATTGTSDSPATTAPAAPPPTTAPAAPPTTAAPTVTPTAAPATTAPATTTSAPTTAPTATVAPSDAPFTQQYVSAGGSITVRWNGVALSLQGVDPADGFDPEIEDDSASRVRVRFRSDDDDARIDVRADDGKVSVEVS